jgi:transcriptional regulator with XRE-family HTH domain
MTTTTCKERFMPQPTPKRAGRTPKAGSRFPGAVLAENVRAYRQVRGLSQEQLAERMAALGHGWTAGIVGFVERGDRNMTVDELLGLALVLGASIGDLLDPAGVDGYEMTALDVGTARAIPAQEAYAWVHQMVVADLVWSGGPLDVRYRPKRGAPEPEPGGTPLADVLNRIHQRRQK